MIKNLLNADEEPPEGTKVIIDDTLVNPAPATPNNEISPAEKISPPPETGEAFEVPAESRFFAKPAESVNEPAALDEDAESLSALMSEIQDLDPEDRKLIEAHLENAPPAGTVPETNAVESVETAPADTSRQTNATTTQKTSDTEPPTIFQSDYTPPSTAETIRNSGLAYSAAIVLVGSVIFMMIFGWFADLLLGSSPWGLVGGILLGGIIGIIQLFRITSQIYKK